MAQTCVEFNLSQNDLHLKVIQLEDVVALPAPCRCLVHGHFNETFAHVWADLPSQVLIDELSVLLAEDALELVDAQLKQPKLGGCVAREMQHHQVVAETQHTFHPEVVDR